MHGPTAHNWQASYEIDPVVAVRWHCLRIPRGTRHALGTRRPPGFFRPNASGDGGAPVGQARMIRIRYCGRNVIERGIGWLKERRSVATRYAKLASTISACQTRYY